MSKQKKHRNSDQGNESPEAAFAREALEVTQQLERGNCKAAVEIAKGLHKRVNSTSSEAVLVNAYVARIASLRQHGMALEADALDNLVRERYPSAAAKLDGSVPASRPTATAAVGVKPAVAPLDDLLRPLLDPAISREERSRIENDLRKRLDDLLTLRDCAVLPADHPLRTGAAAIHEALHAVTSGPVSEEQVALPDISHRSPLAPWKALVRALAGFYSHDDGACERHLQAIDPESPPARAVPVMRELLNGRSDVPLEPSEHALADRVGGLETLRNALQSLDTMLAAGKKSKAMFGAIEKACAACKEAAPDLLVRLRQRLWTLARIADLDISRVDSAMGGQPLMDAWFWLLFARTMEDPKQASTMPACSIWAEFLVHAVHEGWFPRNGPETAGLYLHMAGLLEQIPAEELEHLQRGFRGFPGYRGMYESQPRKIREALAGQDSSDSYYLYPEKLYQRACAIDARPEAFQRWLKCAKQYEHWKPADQVAEAWRRARPDDVRPLLHLMGSAAERDALQKAIGFGEEAERLDPLNPEVRRARLTFLVAAALRHFRTRKPKLAERDLAMLEALPQVQEGTRPAVVAALRWIACHVNRDRGGSAQQFAKVTDLLAGEGAAWLLCISLAQMCGVGQRECDAPEDIPIGPQELRVAIAAKVIAAVGDLGIAFSVPLDWEPAVIRELKKDAQRFDISQLRTLAGAAVEFNRGELAYAISTAGLARGGLTEARFLLVRARALPPWEIERRKNCISAAMELAQRNRDMALVNEAVELRRSELGGFLFDMMGGPQDRALDEKQLSKILQQERAAAAFPTSKAPLVPPWMEGFEDDEFLDDDDDGDIFDDPAFGLFAEELARELKGDARRELPFPRRRRGRRSKF